jgi:hypothetical protein
MLIDSAAIKDKIAQLKKRKIEEIMKSEGDDINQTVLIARIQGGIEALEWILNGMEANEH